MCSMRAHQSWHDWNYEHDLTYECDERGQKLTFTLGGLNLPFRLWKPLGPPTLYNFQSKYK